MRNFSLYISILLSIVYTNLQAQTPVKIAQDGKVGIDLPANTLPTQELHVDGNLRLTDHFYDASNSSGSVGNVLTRGANGTSWTNLSTDSEFTGNELLNAISHGEEQHWATIELGGQSSNRVFQGFVYDYKNNFLYTSHKSSPSGVTEGTTLNKYEFDGSGIPNVVSTSNEIQVGHAQDLSIEYDGDDTYLWTSNTSGRGVSKINFNGSSSSVLNNYELLPSNYGSSTPTISTNGRYLVVRGLDKDNLITNTVFVYKLSDVKSGLTTPFFQWNVDTEQNNQSNVHYFQGILCDNDIVYCLSGYNQTSGYKKLFAYTIKGELIYKKDITTGKSWAISEGNKWEPEGMALYHPHPNIKCLLIGICAEDSDTWSGGLTNLDVDNKRIYSIGLGNGMWSIDGDYHPHDIGLYFGGGSRDITYNHTHSLQFGRWDPTNRNYNEAMRLDDDGNLSINTTSNNGKRFYVLGSAGGSTSWSSSDLRWKENVYPIENALSRITKLRGVHYTWKLGDSSESKGFDDKVHYGVIAQEVENYFPELIDNPGNTKAYKHVEYNGFVGIFIEAIKEQQSTIDSLSKELILMKKEFDNFKKIAVVKQ